MAIEALLYLARSLNRIKIRPNCVNRIHFSIDIGVDPWMKDSEAVEV
jgi:hypothetical protein